MATVYCFRCKKQSTVSNSKIIKTKNNRFRLSAICVICEGKVSKFVSVKTGEGLRDLVNRFNLKLPFELHMLLQDDEGNIRRASFAGPGTKLNRRLVGLNRKTGTFESIVTPPVNDLDAAALKHDIAYAMFKDIPNRNIHDAILARNAQEVANTSTRRIQRINATIVKKIMDFKVKHQI